MTTPRVILIGLICLVFCSSCLPASTGDGEETDASSADVGVCEEPPTRQRECFSSREVYGGKLSEIEKYGLLCLKQRVVGCLSDGGYRIPTQSSTTAKLDPQGDCWIFPNIYPEDWTDPPPGSGCQPFSPPSCRTLCDQYSDAFD